MACGPGPEDLNTLQADAHILLPRLFHCRPQVQGHVVAKHSEKIQIGFSRIGRQKAAPHRPEIRRCGSCRPPPRRAAHTAPAEAVHLPLQGTESASFRGLRSSHRRVLLLAEHRKRRHPSGQFESRPDNRRLRSVNVRLAVERRKILSQAGGILRVAQHQEAVRLQRIEHGAHNALLQALAQIDQQIPATDQIHPGERRVGGEIVSREDAALPQGTGNLVS